MQAAPKFKWTDERLSALLIQVVDAGVKAFTTFKAGGDKTSQKTVWTEEAQGIMPLLTRHTAFEGVAPETMPKYTSVLQTIDRLLEKNAHLYRQGKEQAEPVDVDDPEDTEATKSEELTQLQTLIIEVYELKAEADGSAEELKRKKQEKASSKSAQDAAAKAAFKNISREEFEAARGARSMTSSNDDVPSHIELEEYCMEYDATADYQLIIDTGVAPVGFLLEGPDERGKYFLLRTNGGNNNLKRGRAGASSGGGGGSIRDILSAHLGDKKEEKQKKLKLTERKVDLAEEELRLKQRQVELQEAPEARESERERAREKRDESRAERDAKRDEKMMDLMDFIVRGRGA